MKEVMMNWRGGEVRRAAEIKITLARSEASEAEDLLPDAVTCRASLLCLAAHNRQADFDVRSVELTDTLLLFLWGLLSGFTSSVRRHC
jgi:hypothetical protein